MIGLFHSYYIVCQGDRGYTGDKGERGDVGFPGPTGFPGLQGPPGSVDSVIGPPGPAVSACRVQFLYT